MKKYLSFVIGFGIIAIQLNAQCPQNAGANKTVCNNIEQSASAVQIGPNEPYPGAFSGLSFSWSPGTGLSNPNIRNPYALPDESTTYTLTVTGGNCGILNFNVTVRVAGLIYITNPDNIKERTRAGYNIYYPYEGNYELHLSTEDPNAEWWVYDWDDQGPVLATTGTSYNLEFTGQGNNTTQIYVVSYDDNSFGCSSIDQPTIITHGVQYANQYPVTITNNYYGYSACGPTLPATISQVSNIGGYSASYAWTLKGANASNWNVTSPSGNNATLNRSGGTPPTEVEMYARAYTGTLGPTDPTDYGEVWMIYGIGYHAGAYPTCYPMRPAPGASGVVKTEPTIKPVTTTEIIKTQIYPNPVSSSLTISSKNPVDRIEIYNSAGVQVKSIVGYGKNILYVNTDGLASGLYIVKLIGAKGTEILKMVK